jgi:hypothetical protein
MKKLLEVGLVAALALSFRAAGAWEVASYTPTAVSPRLPTPQQAVRIREAGGTPLWWLRRPHRQAAARGWIGLPALDSLGDRADGLVGQSPGSTTGASSTCCPRHRREAPGDLN